MFYELPNGSRIPSKAKMPVGSIFSLNGKIYRRCPNSIRAAHRGGLDPTINRAFYARSQRRRERGLSPRPYGAGVVLRRC
jgi:hypothetical protein